jgi:hypothetical protein
MDMAGVSDFSPKEKHWPGPGRKRNFRKLSIERRVSFRKVRSVLSDKCGLPWKFPKFPEFPECPRLGCPTNPRKS